MKVILFVTIIVLGDLSLATWLYLHLEEHMEWREWHVPRGTEFAPCPLEYGEHDGLLLTDVEYAIRKDLLEVRYTVENGTRDRHRSATTSSWHSRTALDSGPYPRRPGP